MLQSKMNLPKKNKNEKGVAHISQIASWVE